MQLFATAVFLLCPVTRATLSQLIGQSSMKCRVDGSTPNPWSFVSLD